MIPEDVGAGAGGHGVPTNPAPAHSTIPTVVNPEAIGDPSTTPVVYVGEEVGKALGIRQRTFGRRNPHCSNCGDERGGPFGHEISECLYRSGMTAEELARTMPPEKARTYWSVIVDRYLDEQLAATDRPSGGPSNA